jgi:hypothetical protein
MDPAGAKVEEVERKVATALKEGEISKKRSSLSQFFRIKGLRASHAELVAEDKKKRKEKAEIAPTASKTSTLMRFLGKKEKAKEKYDDEKPTGNISILSRPFVFPWTKHKSGPNLANSSMSYFDVNPDSSSVFGGGSGSMETIDLDAILTGPSSKLTARAEIHDILISDDF